MAPDARPAEEARGDGRGRVNERPTPTPDAPRSPRLHRLADQIEASSALDGLAGRLSGAVRGALGSGRLKDALSGTWLGHPLHPLLTDVALGAWVSAGLLDAIGGRSSERAADRLVGAGALAAVPTALTGLTEWADTAGGARRIGLVHAAANSLGLGLYSASYALRTAGRRRAGLTLGYAGGVAVAAGAYLGGHLSYSRGIGVNRTAFEPSLTEWTPVVDEADVSDQSPVVVDAAGADVMLLRRGSEIFALANRCTHRGGDLHQGEVTGSEVTCPLHGSRFSLRDGSVLRGPASAPAPAYETRVRDGRVELRLQGIHRQRQG